MHVLILGASGMIGNLILNKCLESDKVDKIDSVVRSKNGLVHSKLFEVVHPDFADFNSNKSLFQHVDVAFYCLGVYTSQVKDDVFKTITVDYAKAFADTLKRESPDVTLCFLSGQGADQTEKSSVSFAKYKGMAENYLIQKQFKQLYIFRPSYIYPVEKRKEPNFIYRLMRVMYFGVKLLGKKYSITSVQLAEAMFSVGIKGYTQSILENGEIIKSL
ncbi:MAG: hypothetical protein ABI844_19195 [Saprospiraceae bacterium]